MESKIKLRLLKNFDEVVGELDERFLKPACDLSRNLFLLAGREAFCLRELFILEKLLKFEIEFLPPESKQVSFESIPFLTTKKKAS